MLVRLLYASRAAGGIDDDMLASILESSRTKNPEFGLTGILCVYQDGGVFIQALEGAREAVNTLYNNIIRDERHIDVTLLHYEEIRERKFASWRMGVVDLSKVNPALILRFSEVATLDPFNMNGWAAMALLEELAATAAITSHDRG